MPGFAIAPGVMIRTLSHEVCSRTAQVCQPQVRQEGARSQVCYGNMGGRQIAGTSLGPGKVTFACDESAQESSVGRVLPRP